VGPVKRTEKQEFLSIALKTHTPSAAAPVQSLPVKRPAQTRPGVAWSRKPANHPPEFKLRWQHNQKARQIREAVEDKAIHRALEASIGSASASLPPGALREIKRRCRPGHARPNASIGMYVPPTPEQAAAWAETLKQMEQDWELMEVRRQAAEAAKQAEAAEKERLRLEARRLEAERVAALCPRCGGGKRAQLPNGRFIDCPDCTTTGQQPTLIDLVLAGGRR
jgi:hypothetical protein